VAAELKTEAELVAKAEITLKLIMEEGETPPVPVSFVGDFRTRTGVIIYMLNTGAAAEWLRRPDTLRLFKEKFGGSAEVRAKHFNIIAYYAPISFDPDSEEAKRCIEEVNRLERGSLVHVWYIKPPHRRSPTQRFANVILGFASRADANEAIAKSWITIEDKRGVKVEKLLGEPRRCFKCQSTKGDHTADKCKEESPRCARCAGEHFTDRCETPNQLKCANCAGTDHGAGSRGCPVFRQSVEEYKNRSPEANYRYYPVMGVTYTLELLDGSYAPDFTPRVEDELEEEDEVEADLGPVLNIGDACPPLRRDWADAMQQLDARSKTKFRPLAPYHRRG
jgi:hypothetical protein